MPTSLTVIARHKPRRFLSPASAGCSPRCIRKSHCLTTFGRSDRPAGIHARARTTPAVRQAEAVDYCLASSNGNQVAVRSLTIPTIAYIPVVSDA